MDQFPDHLGFPGRVPQPGRCRPVPLPGSFRPGICWSAHTPEYTPRAVEIHSRRTARASPVSTPASDQRLPAKRPDQGLSRLTCHLPGDDTCHDGPGSRHCRRAAPAGVMKVPARPMRTPSGSRGREHDDSGSDGGIGSSGGLLQEREEVLRARQGRRRPDHGPAARRDRRLPRPERGGQVHFAGHAPRAAEADQRHDPHVRLRPVPRHQVRPGRRDAPVRRADAGGDGARARHPGDRVSSRGRCRSTRR